MQTVTEKAVDYTKFPVDADLEKVEHTKLKNVLERYFEKGGKLECFLSEKVDRKIAIRPGMVVYPVCSGGWCRSQATHAYLEKYQKAITLVLPYAARYGWDPYNGKFNRQANREKELWHDEFPLQFGREKATRFGFEGNDEKWQELEKNPTAENRKTVSRYYDEHYFGAHPDRERLFITFEKNAHVVMNRLAEANISLKKVTVVAVNWADTMTNIPKELGNVQPRSKPTYQLFINKLASLLDTNAL